MTPDSIHSDASLRNYVAQFVNDPRFLLIKDAFVAHTPGGESNEHASRIAHGKFLGTRYVFNELENIARTKPKTEEPKKRPGMGKDPDLEE